jgi:hypothetical protein
MNKISVIILCALLILSAIPFLFASSATSPIAGISYNETFQSTTIRYSATSNSIDYEVIRGNYTGGLTNGIVSLDAMTYSAAGPFAGTSVNVTLSATYYDSTNELRATDSGNGTLLFLSVSQGGETKLVWAGVQVLGSASTSFDGFAYANTTQSAQVQFGFAGSGSIVSTAIAINSTVKATLVLPKVSFTEKSSSTAHISLRTDFPQRYHGLSVSGAGVNSSASITSPMTSVGVGTFDGNSYADMVWSGSVTAGLNTNLLTSSVEILAGTVEFFGANGTAVGYVQSLSANSTSTVTGNYTQFATSGDLIVSASSNELPNLTVIGASALVKVNVGGDSVVVRANSNGEVESTSYIEISHQILVSGSSGPNILVLLNTTISHSYVIVNVSSNSTSSVAEANPVVGSQTTITVGGKNYTAIPLSISASGRIVFNVSVSYLSIIVFKSDASGTVQLNSQNYWLVSGPSSSSSSSNTSSSSSVAGSPGPNKAFVYDNSSGGTYYVAEARPPSSGLSAIELVAIGAGVVVVVAAAVLVLRRRHP